MTDISCEINGVDMLSDLAERIRKRLPDIPTTQIRSEICEIARRFFVESESWRIERQTLLVLKDQTEATLPLSAGVEPVRIFRMYWVDPYYNADCLIPERQDVLRSANVSVSANPDYIVDQYFYLKDPRTIVFNQPWQKDTTLYMNLVIAPMRMGGEIPYNLYERYRDTIESGVMASFLMFPNRKFTDYNLGALKLKEFNDGIRAAKNKHLRDMRQGRPTYRGPNEHIAGYRTRNF